MNALENYHLIMALAGTGLILAYWVPRFISGREPAPAALLIAAGSITGVLQPELAGLISPTIAPGYWEHITEVALIIGLFGTGLKFDRIKSWSHWQPTLRLLFIAMPATIVCLWFFGTYFGGLTLAGGLLLGAILAPTDPLLASEVQVGPPLEGGEHPIRYTLTTEAGLNDGFGFPFVYLALAIAGTAMITPAFITNWVFVDILYRTVAGFGIGAGIGIALSKVLFDYPHQNPLAQTRCGVVAIGGVLLCYGITELCKGYGFIAVFTAGVVLRHSESKHKFHRTLHGVTDPIEQVMTAFILFALGVVMPLLMDSLDWFHASIALFLIFFLRPVFGWLSLYGTSMEKHNRAVVSFYGVRGIGSIYYIAFASTHLELTNNGELWSIVGFTILVSAIVHGLTAGLVIERATEQS